MKTSLDPNSGTLLYHFKNYSYAAILIEKYLTTPKVHLVFAMIAKKAYMLKP